MNVGGSRMREIRTYGLKGGCWPVRFARRAGVDPTRERGCSCHDGVPDRPRNGEPLSQVGTRDTRLT